jgi:hypothetical protein
MGNPHPTKSKPIKIGRKHTGAASTRVRQRRADAARAYATIKEGLRRRFHERVRQYFAGARDNYPTA